MFWLNGNPLLHTNFCFHWQTHTVLQTTSPPSILFSLTHTNHNKTEPLHQTKACHRTHLWVSGECVNPLLRKTRVPYAACIITFLFSEAGLWAAPSALGCRGQPVPKERSARQQGQMEHTTQRSPVGKAFSIHVMFLMSEMKRDGKSRDAPILKFSPISIRQSLVTADKIKTNYK